MEKNGEPKRRSPLSFRRNGALRSNGANDNASHNYYNNTAASAGGVSHWKWKSNAQREEEDKTYALA